MKETFAKGVCYYKIALCFVLGSVIGTLYEELITLIKYGEFQSRRGVLYGPFNPLYGLAFISVIILFHRIKHPVKLFIIGGLYGMLFEIIAGIIQLLLFGSRSWDYTGQFMNLYGFTTPLYGAIWGIFVLIILKGIYPITSLYIEKIPIKLGKIIANTLFILLMLNLALTAAVLSRQSLRHKGYEPLTFIGELIDQVYTDEVIQKHFPDMIYE